MFATATAASTAAAPAATPAASSSSSAAAADWDYWDKEVAKHKEIPEEKRISAQWSWLFHACEYSLIRREGSSTLDTPEYEKYCREYLLAFSRCPVETINHDYYVLVQQSISVKFGRWLLRQAQSDEIKYKEVLEIILAGQNNGLKKELNKRIRENNVVGALYLKLGRRAEAMAEYAKGIEIIINGKGIWESVHYGAGPGKNYGGEYVLECFQGAAKLFPDKSLHQELFEFGASIFSVQADVFCLEVKDKGNAVVAVFHSLYKKIINLPSWDRSSIDNLSQCLLAIMLYLKGVYNDLHAPVRSDSESDAESYEREKEGIDYFQDHLNEGDNFELFDTKLELLKSRKENFLLQQRVATLEQQVSVAAGGSDSKDHKAEIAAAVDASNKRFRDDGSATAATGTASVKRVRLTAAASTATAAAVAASSSLYHSPPPLASSSSSAAASAAPAFTVPSAKK